VFVKIGDLSHFHHCLINMDKAGSLTLERSRWLYSGRLQTKLIMAAKSFIVRALKIIGPIQIVSDDFPIRRDSKKKFQVFSIDDHAFCA
jgi:hypothetical protein